MEPVRYGRVPKRTRDIGGNSIVDDLSNGIVVNSNQQNASIVLTNIRVVNSVSSSSSTAPTSTPIATSTSTTYLASSNDIGSGQTALLKATSDVDSMEHQRIFLWQQYALRMTPLVQRVVEFAKRVPGFCDFTQDDQLILIKLGFFEVWLNYIAKTTTDMTLTFDDGTFLTRQQLEIIDTEIGLYSALILLAADRPGITEQKLILKTRERVAEALRVQIIRSRPNTANALQIMPALEAKIMELRSLGLRHFNHLDWFRINWQMSSRLPPLFVEIFDIPKSEEDLQ
ncbi:CLUMA_CG015899, isoform A [Clunio marinus]|uniref:CLUMA_CG015899, isoform A n=1 Tax=Clunio marinus TaxID=568069 RepID=A0A1J1IWL8_9DIPT|nr:CLUMA_CG015899, isoform A [Clunio marinus]